MVKPKSSSTATNWKQRATIILFVLAVIAVLILSIMISIKDKQKQEMKDSIMQTVVKAKVHNIVYNEMFGETIVSPRTDEHLTPTNGITVNPSTESSSSSTESAPELATGLTSYLDSLSDKQANGDSSGVEIIEVLSSNKIKIKINNKEETVRLIGVSSGGEKKSLQALIDISETLTIETDTKKKDDKYMLVYLWGDDRLINLEMVATGSAQCSYNAGSNIIEHPNIKYFGEFIDATKAAKR